MCVTGISIYSIKQSSQTLPTKICPPPKTDGLPKSLILLTVSQDVTEKDASMIGGDIACFDIDDYLICG